MAIALTACMATIGQETLPPLKDGIVPQTCDELWGHFDPRAETLDIEALKEWEEDGVVLRIVRYRIGIFRGRKALMAGVYGFPRGGTKLPGLVQIHGGGQYADYRAPLYNAKRGYATISISWAGRIAAPDYQVDPRILKLFWDGKTRDPAYKLTTDWGALDAYHAPTRHEENRNWQSLEPAPWTLDDVESPRNSNWFLCTLGARRALTFLEQQPEVDPDRLGVYGHSMGGRLTVMTAGSDARVKAAAPSCGGISKRAPAHTLIGRTVSDNLSLQHITCPLVFLSPSNDFHGRINDLEKAVREIASTEWRVTCSPHHNHQDTAEYMVAGPLWFDQHLKDAFTFPATPGSQLELKTGNGVPTFTVTADPSRQILSVDVYYTQQGRDEPGGDDRENTIHRFWHHADARRDGETWTAALPLLSTDPPSRKASARHSPPSRKASARHSPPSRKASARHSPPSRKASARHSPPSREASARHSKPLWVYANVVYALDAPVTGAGYYYGPYTAATLNLSSMLHIATSAQLIEAGVRATMEPSLTIESFEEGWQKEWFTYDLTDNWARRTHKIYDDQWQPPSFAKLAVEVRSDQPNKMVVGVGEFATEVQLKGNSGWESIILFPTDFHDVDGRSFLDWTHAKELRIGPRETLRSGTGAARKTLVLGAEWQGAAPEFRALRWVEGTKQELNARRTVKLPKATAGNPRAYLAAQYADAFSSHRPVRMNTDMHGKPLTVDGETYAHGMTVHAPSEATFFLGGKYTTLHAIAAAGRVGTVAFQVALDGKNVYDSGLLKRNEFRTLDLRRLEHAQELQLIVTDGGNGKGGDWAHWVDAWVETGPQ